MNSLYPVSHIWWDTAGVPDVITIHEHQLYTVWLLVSFGNELTSTLVRM